MDDPNEELFFHSLDGGQVPASVHFIAAELLGNKPGLDKEVLRQATLETLRHFREDLQKNEVSIEEFADVLASSLQTFGYQAFDEPLQTDLEALAAEAKYELFFFARLGDELKSRFQKSPELMDCRGLRGCVKTLLGKERWTPLCQVLSDQIVEFTRRQMEKSKTSCCVVIR